MHYYNLSRNSWTPTSIKCCQNCLVMWNFCMQSQFSWSEELYVWFVHRQCGYCAVLFFWYIISTTTAHINIILYEYYLTHQYYITVCSESGQFFNKWIPMQAKLHYLSVTLIHSCPWQLQVYFYILNRRNKIFLLNLLYMPTFNTFS